MTAQWVKDMMSGEALVEMGDELRKTAFERRCRVGVNKFTGTGSEKLCTLDIGHHGTHECNVRRDIEGKEDS
jgi:hypothetical protein